MNTKSTLGNLLLLTALAGSIGTTPAALAVPAKTTAVQDALSGDWSGKLDWINVRMTLKLQGRSVTGTFMLGDVPFDLTGEWDAASGHLSFRYLNHKRPVQVKGVVKNGAFTGTATISGQTDKLVMQRKSAAVSSPAGGSSNPVTPYVMKGVVRDAQGNPVAGADVFADNTLYYNMNARGRTDAQGRYSIELPRQELGTWVAGAYVKREYHGVTHEFRLYADNEGAFSAASGAVRNFVWRLSGQHSDGYLGKLVYVYITEGVRLSDVEVTLTPAGPLVDGSAGTSITRRVSSGRIEDVPVGRYTMTARLVREGHRPVPLLVSPGQGGTFGTSATANFEKSNYGVIMEFTVKLGQGAQATTEPVISKAGTNDRSIAGELSAGTDLKGTVVMACVEENGECDEATQRELVVHTSGRTASYRFDNLMVGRPYNIYAWKDLNGDGEVGKGDLVGMYGAHYGVDDAGKTVTAPSSDADFELATWK